MTDLLNLDSLLDECVTPPSYGEVGSSKNDEVVSSHEYPNPIQNETIPTSSQNAEEIQPLNELNHAGNDIENTLTDVTEESQGRDGNEDKQFGNKAISSLLIDDEIKEAEISPPEVRAVCDSYIEISNVIGSANLSDIFIKNTFHSEEIKKEIAESFGLRPFESVLKYTYGLDDNFISLMTAKSLDIALTDSAGISGAVNPGATFQKAILKDDGFIEILEMDGGYTYYVWSPSGIVAAKESFLAIERDHKGELSISGQLKICTKQAAVKILSAEFCNDWFKSIPRAEYASTFSVYLKNQADSFILVETMGGGGQRVSVWSGRKRIYSKLLPAEIFDDVAEHKGERSTLESEVLRTLRFGGQVGSAINVPFVTDTTAIEAYELINSGKVKYESTDAIFMKTSDAEFVFSFAKALLYKNGDERPVSNEESSVGVMIQKCGDKYLIQLGNEIDELEFVQNSRLLTLEDCKVNRVEVMQ